MLPFVHTFREGNYCGDFIAKMGAKSNGPLVFLDPPPTEMDILLLADAMGTSL